MEPTGSLRDLLGRGVVLRQGEAFIEGVVSGVDAAVSVKGKEQVFLRVTAGEREVGIELTSPSCDRGRWLAPLQKAFDPEQEIALEWLDGEVTDASPASPASSRLRTSELAE